MRRIQLIILFAIFFCGNVQNIFAQNKAIFLSNETAWVDSVMATLSEEERISQLFMVAAYSNKGEEHKQEITNLVEKYKIGGLMFLQGGPVRQAQLTLSLIHTPSPRDGLLSRMPSSA